MHHHTSDKFGMQDRKGAGLPDILAAGLDVLFCGINPGLSSAAGGHHFARPGNRFWPALHLAGFTDSVLSPADDRSLLQFGCGLTTIAARPTARADEVSREELLEGVHALEKKLDCYRPRYLAVMGIGAFRTAFQRRQATWGRQEKPIGQTPVWVLPNPSGLNRNFRLSDLVRAYRELKLAVDQAD